MATRRDYKNGPEQGCAKALLAQGLGVSKRGWPDFSVWDKDGTLVMVVEVKPRSCDILKGSQMHMLKALSDAGIKVMRWSVDGGFEEFNQGAENHRIFVSMFGAEACECPEHRGVPA